MHAATTLAPHTKGGKGVKPEKLWPFAWDKKASKSKSTKMSQERLEYLSKRSKIIRNG